VEGDGLGINVGHVGTQDLLRIILGGRARGLLVPGGRTPYKTLNSLAFPCGENFSLPAPRPFANSGAAHGHDKTLSDFQSWRVPAALQHAGPDQSSPPGGGPSSTLIAASRPIGGTGAANACSSF
jgi:hypothetical protein